MLEEPLCLACDNLSRRTSSKFATTSGSRYKGGFPILKELLQNADDAGGGAPGASASEMVLLLAPGIPNSRHVLLQAPGLCLLNDGDFTAGDAISISSYGSSNRGSQSATVGRFGLGLKSIFHWAEAFFYFSPAQFRRTRRWMSAVRPSSPVD